MPLPFASSMGTMPPGLMMAMRGGNPGAGTTPGSLAPQIPTLPSRTPTSMPAMNIPAAPQPPQSNLISSLMPSAGGQAMKGMFGGGGATNPSAGLFGSNGPLFGSSGLFGMNGPFSSPGMGDFALKAPGVDNVAGDFLGVDQTPIYSSSGLPAAGVGDIGSQDALASMFGSGGGYGALGGLGGLEGGAGYAGLLGGSAATGAAIDAGAGAAAIGGGAAAAGGGMSLADMLAAGLIAM